MARRSAVLAGIVASLLVPADSAAAQYRVDAFTTSNGLPQNTVSAIAQTPDGYLWFATYDGLARYDGVRFTVFDKGNTPAIRHNQFLTLLADRTGTLWGGTVEGGLVRYREGAFASFTRAEGLPDDYVGKIVDRPDGVLVFFGGETPSAVWTRDGRLRAVNDEGPQREYVDRAGARWVLGQTGLVRTRDGRQTRFAVSVAPDEFGRFHYEDRSDALWIGTRTDGVYRIAGDTLSHYKDELGIPLGTSPVRIGGQDRDGRIWLFTDHFLLRFADGRFTPQPVDYQGLRAVFCDREGTVWVGTNGNGLLRLTRRFLTAYGPAQGLPKPVVYPVLEDRAGAMWFGSGGLTRLAGGRFTLEREGEARSLREDRDGRLWVGAGRTLMSREDNGQWTEHAGFPGQIDVILQDRAGDLWLGTGQGLVKLHGGAVVREYTIADGLPDNAISQALEDRAGRLWVGTRGGLGRLDGDRFTAFTEREGLAGNRVRALHEDADGVLWIGSFDSGLTRLKDGRLTKITTENGLHNNGVFQILEDERGYFWISSNRGISRVSRKQLNDFADGRAALVNSVASGTEDGMLSAECNGGRQPAGVKARDGRLWFPTQIGVVVVDPHAIDDSTPPPPPVVESAAVDGAPVDFRRGIRLAAGQKDLEISYTAPSGIKAEHIQFRYTMSGLNEGWLDAGTRRSVHYSHLPPGRFTFQVAAANADGMWGDPTEVVVDMAPYFYQTRWFVWLSAAVIAFVGPTFYALRVRQLKRRERKLTALVAERTAELTERTGQLEVANELLHQLATVDGLTNIANHRTFETFLTREWQRTFRLRAPVSLLLIDVDHFKAFNDTYGHQAGDSSLRQVAAVLAVTVHRATDLAARYGGEEFAAVLPGTDAHGAAAVAEIVRAAVEALAIPHSASAAAPHVTVSIGVATMMPSEGMRHVDLIGAADRALYAAKAAGRNRAVRHEDTGGSRQ